MLLFDNDLIKCCPMCAVPIEKDEGCAQMMCKRCKHVFCWYCLASLDVSLFVSIYNFLICKFPRFVYRMISCSATTTKALVKISSVIHEHLLFGIELKSSGFSLVLEFYCSSLRHFYCSVSRKTLSPRL